MPSGDLLSLLAAAERDLAADAAAPSEGTLDSEERDQLLLSQQIEDDLERKSQSSLSARNSHRGRRIRTSRHGQGTSGEGGSSGLLSGMGAQSSSSHSGSALSCQQLQQLQQRLFQSAGHSSASGGSEPMPVTEELLRMLQQSSQHMAKMRAVQAASASKHKQEMARIQGHFDLVREQEQHAEKEKVAAEARVSVVEAAQQVEIDVIQKKLETTKEIKDNTEEAIQEKHDLLEELEADALVKLDALREGIQAKRHAHQEHDDAMRKVNYEEKAKMKSDISTLAAQLEKSKKELKMASDERDVLQRNVVAGAGVEEKVGNFQQVLELTKKELIKVEMVLEDPELIQRDEALTPDWGAMRDLLNQSKESEKAMEGEIESLRARWWQEKRQLDTAAQKLDSKGVAVGARAVAGAVGGSRLTGGGSSSSSGPSPSGSSGSGGRKANLQKQLSSWAGRLTSIAEEEAADLISYDGSMAPREGGDYASEIPAGADGESHVADLTDFDVKQAMVSATPAAAAAAIKVKEKLLKEKVRALEEKKEETKRMKEELKEEMAEKEATLQPKIVELRSKVSEIKEEAVEKEEAAIELEQVVAKEDVKVVKVVEEVRVELAIAERKKDIKAEHVEELFAEVQHQEKVKEDNANLWVELTNEYDDLNKAQKDAEAKAEEWRMKMETVRSDQERVVQELKQELSDLRREHGIEVEEPDENEDFAKPMGTDESRPPVTELEQLQRELGQATEERNMLLNTMEWKEVQWRNEIEELEHQIVAEGLQLKNKYKAELEELRAKLEAEAEELRKKLSAQ